MILLATDTTGERSAAKIPAPGIADNISVIGLVAAVPAATIKGSAAALTPLILRTSPVSIPLPNNTSFIAFRLRSTASPVVAGKEGASG